MAASQDAQTFGMRSRSVWYFKYKRGRVCYIMPGVSPTWEKHINFITGKASHCQSCFECWLIFLYREVDALFVALDANFRLRRRAVLNDQNDPSLSQGWAYFMEDMAFKKYLCDRKDDTQEACRLTP